MIKTNMLEWRIDPTLHQFFALRNNLGQTKAYFAKKYIALGKPMPKYLNRIAHTYINTSFKLHIKEIYNEITDFNQKVLEFIKAIREDLVYLDLNDSDKTGSEMYLKNLETRALNVMESLTERTAHSLELSEIAVYLHAFCKYQLAFNLRDPIGQLDKLNKLPSALYEGKVSFEIAIQSLNVTYEILMKSVSDGKYPLEGLELLRPKLDRLDALCLISGN